MTTSFDRVAPILSVPDVAAALVHYRKLEFTADAYGGDVDSDGPIYGFLSRGPVELHLARVLALDPNASTSACYLYVADATRTRSARSGAPRTCRASSSRRSTRRTPCVNSRMWIHRQPAARRFTARVRAHRHCAQITVATTQLPHHVEFHTALFVLTKEVRSRGSQRRGRRSAS
jgi:hypothetical protein